MSRLFIAAHLDCKSLKNTCALQKQLRPKLPSGRWTAPENLHLTLVFIGKTEESQIPTIKSHIQHTVSNSVFDTPIIQALDTFVGLPSMHSAKVLALGSRQPTSSLQGLQTRVFRTICALGFELEKRPFWPHVTVARFRSPVKIAPIPFPNPICLEIKEITLFASNLHSQGAKYQRIKEFPLARSDKA